MKNTTKIIIGILVVFGITAVSLVSTYNGLIEADARVDRAWAEIDNKLQRRNDLIPNLVNSVQGAMEHEEEVFNSIAEARTQIGNAENGSIEDQMAANSQMSSAVTNLIAIAESYPELRSNDNVTNLMDELAGTENRISTERGRYNQEVQKLNTVVRRFPTSIIANMSGFSERPYFEADEGARNAPEVNFD